MSRHTRATTVVSHPLRFSTPLAPDRLRRRPYLLHGVVRLAWRAEHPVSDRTQVGAASFESLCQAVVLVHLSHSPFGFRHSSDEGNPPDVTRRSEHLSPYINFQGNAREAMEFYQKVLGGNLMLRTVNEKDRITHAQLDADQQFGGGEGFYVGHVLALARVPHAVQHHSASKTHVTVLMVLLRRCGTPLS